MRKTWLPISMTIFMVLGCTQETGKQVSFSKDVAPIFNKYCVSCHAEGGAGFRKTGIRFDSYKSLMQSHTITPGDTSKSLLLTVIHPSADHAKSMPLRGEKLSKHEITAIESWIAQGARDN